MEESTKAKPFCVFDNVFKEKTEYISYSFEVYKKIYSLPTIKYEKEVSEELFNYQKNKKHFILLVPYDEVGRMYLERNVQEKIYWALPGGSIHKNEDFHMAIKRIANKLNSNSKKLLLREVEPAAFIENKFKFKDQSYTHYGIAFMSKIRNNGALETEDSEGCFVRLDEDEINNINHYSNKEVARLCNNKIKLSTDTFPEAEVSTNEKYQYRYFIHNNIVKRFILTPKLKKKEKFLKLIAEKTKGANSFLDISCGDSDVLKQLISFQNFDYIVGNDVSWSQIDFINNINSKVIYTNHNAVHLPFRDNSFDVSYCGNTLHHLNSQSEMRLVLDSMLRISKKIIIVEIEKPENTGLIPYLLNKYWYQKFLGDVGSSYLSKDDFQSVLKEHFLNRAEIEFSEFNNIQGRYLIAEITKKEPNNKILEVEQKFLCLNNVALENTLKNENFIEMGTERESDNYYSDLEGDFIKSRTCLRIRTRNNFAELTHKGKSHSFFGSFSKVEHNIAISPGLVPEYNDILNSLGFAKYVTVEKTRRTFLKTLGYYRCIVAIDNLNSIGEFIELEISGSVDNKDVNKGEAENLLQKMIEIFSSCDLKPANFPYRDYVANYLAKEFLHKTEIKTIIINFEECLVPQKENSELEKLITSSKVLNSFSAVRALKKAGYQIALVSSASAKQVNDILLKTGNEQLFEQLVTSDDIDRAQTKETGYQLSLKKMNISPDSCLALVGSVKELELVQLSNSHAAIISEFTQLSKSELLSYNLPIFDNITQIFMILSYSD